MAPSADRTENRWTTLLVVTGFVAVAVAQVSNMIVARANAGAIPPFASPASAGRSSRRGLRPSCSANCMRDGAKCCRAGAAWVVPAGFCGMFLCGGPIYIAGISTTAINIALIMALSPLVACLSSPGDGAARPSGASSCSGIGSRVGGALVDRASARFGAI